MPIMLFPPKLIYWFNVTYIKKINGFSYFGENSKMYKLKLKYIWKYKGPTIVTTILKEKRTKL